MEQEYGFSMISGNWQPIKSNRNEYIYIYNLYKVKVLSKFFSNTVYDL